MNYEKCPREELIQMLTMRERPVRCTNPRAVFDYLQECATSEVELFVVLALDASGNIRFCKVVGQGTVSRCLVHPREVYRVAIEHNASSVCVAHVHPSGNLDPSSDDLEVTMRLKRAGELIGIPLIDHIVFGTTGFHSMAEHGELLR